MRRAPYLALAAPVLAMAAPYLALAAPIAFGGCLSFDGAVAGAGYLDFEGAARVCARLAACPELAGSLRQSLVAPLDGDDFSACLSWLAGPTGEPPGGFGAQAEVLARIAAASSCEEALAPLPVRLLAEGDDRCPGPIDRCTDTGDVLDCHGRRQVRCPGAAFARGGCLVKDDVARCATGACIVGVAGLPACDGTALSVCEEGVNLKQLVACGAAGASCVTTPEPVSWSPVLHAKVAVCTTPDNPTPAALCRGAPADGFTTCTPDGAAVVLCDHVQTIKELAVANDVRVGEMEILYPCRTDLGFRCQAGATGVARCARADAECAPGDADVNRCDGDVIEVCIGGRRERVDCAAAGAACRDGTHGARCVAL